jgi:hypothetical protein
VRYQSSDGGPDARNSGVHIGDDQIDVILGHQSESVRQEVSGETVRNFARESIFSSEVRSTSVHSNLQLVENAIFIDLDQLERLAIKAN